MKPIVIESNWILDKLSWFFNIYAITLFPFIITRDKSNKIVMNHEKIHIMQQLELLVVGFWVIYIGNYLYNLFKYRDVMDAYNEIIFEREAYEYEKDLNYLDNRGLFACFKKK
jgi:hypothetical protein